MDTAWATRITSREQPSSLTCMGYKSESRVTRRKYNPGRDFDGMTELQRLFAHPTLVEDGAVPVARRDACYGLGDNECIFKRERRELQLFSRRTRPSLCA